MKPAIMRIGVVYILLLIAIAGQWAMAQQPITSESGVATCDSVQRFESRRDTLVMGDSIVVIHTVCAPICSSCARVYNKEGQELGRLQPDIQSIFPEAYIEDGKIMWRDNDEFDYTPAK